nr:MAG: ORF1 [Anelloviridae sp.]
MPYYSRYYRRRWRPRRFWRRRFRRPFQRRFWRRRYSVRRKKLKKLRLAQWQPHTIKKCKIIGYYPLAISTRDRLSENLNCYLDSVAPHLIHSGGGFSICNWSLYALYRENIEMRNWWTTGNDNLPLCRYLGCKITLYRQAEVDYMFAYRNSFPMTASIHTYQSTNPQVMLLNNRTRKMPCKKHNRNKKPYRKLFIRPPSQLQNKWYMQHDIAQTPLLQTFTTLCSFDRMYQNSSSISNTIGFTGLDTNGFKNHYFKTNGTHPYAPIHDQILIAIPNSPITNDISKTNILQCIILGTITDYTPGTLINACEQTVTTTITPTPTSQEAKKLYNAYTKVQHWGNPFHADYFHGDILMAMSNKTINELINHFNSTPTLETTFTIKTQKYIEYRYNPFADKGEGNKLYLVPINTQLHSDDWSPPTDKEVLCEDLPINVMLWGYLDFQRKCREYNDIDTTCLCVIQTKYITPNNGPKFIVPLDDDVLYGNSPYYTEGHRTASDQQNWHPKVRFQTRTLNNIACTSIATAKLPRDTSVECHMKYCFYFKFGGEIPPMSITKNPEDQPKFPIPNNLLQQPSLQSPTTPFEYFLYKFDQRRGMLTKSAIERITKNQKPETDILSIADPSTWCPTTLQQEKETSEESTSEEEQTSSTEERLQQQRRKQKHLRKLINRLLLRLTTLE